MKRFHQLVLIGSILPLSWLGMMLVHEFGHVLGAWFTGGTVAKVVAQPWTISRTDVAPNPHPLIVAWAGPVGGVVMPIAALVFWRVAQVPGSYLARFFAGFCLIANGAYLGVGSFDAVGDAGDLVRHGASMWHLWAFGIVTTPLGLFLWHRLGPNYGLGKARGKVQPIAAYAVFAFLVFVIVGEFLLGGE